MRIILFLICLSFPIQSNAERYSECGEINELAEEAMKLRQNGHPISRAMKSVKSDMGEMIVDIAYRFPQFASELYRERTIAEFRDYWYLLCIKTLRQLEED